MSNKPLKASTEKKLKAVMQKRQKKIETLHELPPYTVIFCEGTKTEPFYIRGFTNRVNQRYAQFTSKDRIIVIGTGRNTKGLLEYARRTVRTRHPACKVVWLMYDKDDFPHDDFDNTQFSAEGRTCEQEYHAAWSNACIELWFLLHYQQLFSDISREQYREKLKEYFPYEKNLESIYDILEDKTQTAVDHARELYASYEENTPPSQRAPATRVHELVAFLLEYLL
jgi:hypothetical protein